MGKDLFRSPWEEHTQNNIRNRILAAALMNATQHTDADISILEISMETTIFRVRKKRNMANLSTVSREFEIIWQMTGEKSVYEWYRTAHKQP